MSTFALTAIIIAIALTFDFINGFHDAANSVATVVATRVLTPLQAVRGLVVGQWPKTLAFMVFAPVLGLALAYILMIAVYWLFRKSTPYRMDKHFRRLQLLSAAMYSFAHGTNDAQKTMGIIRGVLTTSGYLRTFRVPIWVVLAAHAAIALGTMCGGWRIVHTMGMRLTRLKPRSGFCAETAAAASILFATFLKQPVSTTHVIAGSIAGVGSIQRIKAVRWGLATDIVWAWVLTIPASASIAALAYVGVHLFSGS